MSLEADTAHGPVNAPPTRKAAVSRQFLVTTLPFLLVLATLFFLPLFVVKANRIAEGTAQYALASHGTGIAGWLIVAVLLGAAVCLPNIILRAASAVLALNLILLVLGFDSRQLSADAGPYARVSIGSAGWLIILSAMALAGNSISKAKIPIALAAPLVGATFAVLTVAASVGVFDTLALVIEFRSRSDLFFAEFSRHIVLAYGAVVIAAVIGIPLVFFLRHYATGQQTVLVLLDFVQTIPSIALFSLLIPPVAWLGQHIGGLGAIGFKGIGWAPAMIALVLYSLFPIARNTRLATSQIPAALLEIADGIGMSRWQRAWRVELPLALPLMLSGFRIALVQAIGLTCIAALIGGGGLGVLIFKGISETANDLLLLGVLPVIGLVLITSFALDALIGMMRTSAR